MYLLYGFIQWFNKLPQLSLSLLIWYKLHQHTLKVFSVIFHQQMVDGASNSSYIWHLNIRMPVACSDAKLKILQMLSYQWLPPQQHCIWRYAVVTDARSTRKSNSSALNNVTLELCVRDQFQWNFGQYLCRNQSNCPVNMSWIALTGRLTARFANRRLNIFIKVN